MKGSRDRTANREAYRNSPVWDSIVREAGGPNDGRGASDSHDSSASRRLQRVGDISQRSEEGETSEADPRPSTTAVLEGLEPGKSYYWNAVVGDDGDLQFWVTETPPTIRPDLPPGVNEEDVPV